MTIDRIKQVLARVISLTERYLDAAEQHHEATMFDDEDDIEAANLEAEDVYPDLSKAIAEAKELLA